MSQFIVYLIEYLAPLLIASGALSLGIYNFMQSHHRRRRRLIDAIYYHATKTIEDLEAHQKNNPKIRKTIEDDDSYTPFFVADSPINDLVYDQVIEVMEWLKNRDEGEVILHYFHKQSDLHGHAQSFNLDFVQDWNQERKLVLWGILEERQKETLGFARATANLLREKRSPGYKPV